MNNEYEFFKQFAGVTESDLQVYKCGGKSKKVKKGCGGGCAFKLKGEEGTKLAPNKTNPLSNKNNGGLKNPSDYMHEKSHIIPPKNNMPNRTLPNKNQKGPKDLPKKNSSTDSFKKLPYKDSPIKSPESKNKLYTA